MHIAAKKFTFFAIYLAVLLIIAALCLIAGYQASKNGQLVFTGVNNQFDSVLSQQIDTGILNGKVIGKGNDYLEVEISAAQGKLSRRVLVNQETRLRSQREKTPQELASSGQNGEMIEPVVVEAIGIEDINVGDRVVVYTQDKVMDNKEITATMVTVIK